MEYAYPTSVAEKRVQIETIRVVVSFRVVTFVFVPESADSVVVSVMHRNFQLCILMQGFGLLLNGYSETK